MNVSDIISLIALAASIILLLAAHKKQQKSLKYMGIILIIVFLALSAPDFIRGFIKGFNEGFNISIFIF